MSIDSLPEREFLIDTFDVARSGLDTSVKPSIALTNELAIGGQ